MTGDTLRHEQNSVSASIPKASKEDRPALIARGKEVKEQIAANEAALKDLEPLLRAELVRVPNMTHPEAPVGGEALEDFQIDGRGRRRGSGVRLSSASPDERSDCQNGDGDKQQRNGVSPFLGSGRHPSS